MNEEKFDYKRLLVKGLKYWYIFLLIFPLFLLGAYFYLKTTPPQYRAVALLQIKSEETSSQLDEEAIFSELGLGKQSESLENETMVLRSTPILEEVVRNLKLQYQYFKLGQFMNEELYTDSPIRVVDWQPKNSAQPELAATLEFTGDNSYRLSFEDDDKTYKGEFGKPVRLPYGALMLSSSRERNIEGPMALYIHSTKGMANGLSGKLEVNIVGENSSILQLSIKDRVPQRAQELLSELITVYNRRSVAERNQVFENSIGLINERIQLINEELSEVEEDVASYKSRFSIGELSAEGSMLMQELSDYNRQISGTELQLQILNSIEDFLQRNRDNFEFVPTNLSINNLTLTNQLESFNKLLSERARMRNDLGPSHPDLKLTEKQIQNLRESIIANVKAMQGDLQITRESTANQRNDLETRMRSLPRRERELIEIERRKTVKENLYLYLLEKREESAISMAVTVPNGKVVEPPQLPVTPVSPKKAQIWLIAFFLGLALPTAVAFLLEGLNDRLQIEDEIEKLTSVPLGGMVSFNKKKDRMVVKENSHSPQAEMFRLLRANLAYIAAGENLRTLLITSSMSGEGKSFIAMNLGMTQALTGKRVLILELDLRKPKQEEYINLERSEEGVVNYLVDQSISVANVIRNTGMHPNLDIISSGPKPPNPSELILSARLRELVDELRSHYDFIIIDAPPVGLVADALQMKDLAEATMYVVRIGYTRKAQLRILQDIAQKNKLPRPFIVANAVKFNASYGNSYYGYGYGYGYGYSSKSGYYQEVD